MEEIKKSLGQLARDPYGRPIGRIVGLESDANDKTKSIKMISEKGDFLEFPIVQTSIENNSVICLSPREKEAREILKQLKTLNQRINALDQLYRSGDIREESYKSLKKNYESSFSKIKECCEDILEKMEERKQNLVFADYPSATSSVTAPILNIHPLGFTRCARLIFSFCNSHRAEVCPSA